MRFILPIFLLLDGCWAWQAHKTLRGWVWRGFAAVWIGVQAACVVLMMVWPMALRSSQSAVPVGLAAAVYIWHLVVLPLSLVIWLVWTAVWGGLRIVRRRPPVVPAVAASGPTRRQVLGAAAVAMPAVMTTWGASAALGQLGQVRIRRMTLRLPGLRPGLEGITIAHVSDIHTGRYLPPENLPALVRKINALEADLVLLTGDLIDYSIEDLAPALAAVKRIRARYGLAMCVGNHDLFHAPHIFVRDVRASGVPLLWDESMSLIVRDQEVQLLGIQWSRHDADLAAAVHQVAALRRAEAFPILLAHHPHAFDAAAEARLPLTLSGHTHGGQLMLTPHIGAGPFMFKYWSGLYRKQESQLVVSNGVGNWFPLRINAPAEIVHLTLRGVV